jgi:hypothetical protein
MAQQFYEQVANANPPCPRRRLAPNTCCFLRNVKIVLAPTAAREILGSNILLADFPDGAVSGSTDFTYNFHLT